MKKEDNIQIQMRHFKMENVRLHGEVSRLNQYVVFLEEENRTVESEIRSESQVNDLGFVSTERRYEAPMCCTPGASK